MVGRKSESVTVLGPANGAFIRDGGTGRGKNTSLGPAPDRHQGHVLWITDLRARRSCWLGSRGPLLSGAVSARFPCSRHVCNHYGHRRKTVCQTASNTGGNSRQVEQPVVATNTIAASTSPATRPTRPPHGHRWHS